MRIIKHISFLLVGMAVILVLAFWGFKQNFPGKSIADAVRFRLTSQTGIPFEIQDIELGWSKISTPEIVLRTPKWLAGIPDIRLLILENLEVPFFSIITSGKAKVHGQVHEGAFRISTELLTQKILDLSIDSVQIERVPLFSLVPYTFVSGFLSLSAHIENFNALQQQKTKFPEGTIKGKLKNARIRISGGTALLDLQLPELDLSEVQFEVQLGRSIHIKKIELQGSLEGIIEGTIQLNEKRPQMSLIDLNIQVTPSPALKKGIS
ncbi:uncharacterized protein METZ01_LOCUS78636, partial [marine metagenome]